MGYFPTDLAVLTYLAQFATTLWVPAVKGAPDPFLRPNDIRSLPERIHRAHRRMPEQFVPVAVLVLLVDRADGLTADVAICLGPIEYLLIMNPAQKFFAVALILFD